MKKTGERRRRVPARGRKLEEKQLRFAAEYMKDFNASQAAIRAGYAQKRAGVAGSSLLKHPRIAALIQGERQKLIHKAEITQERIVRELALMGFANMADFIRIDPLTGGLLPLDWSHLTRDQAAALSEVTVTETMTGRGEDAERVRHVKFKLHDKRQALVNLHQILYPDKSAALPGGGADLFAIIRGVAAELPPGGVALIQHKANGDGRDNEEI